MTDQLVRATAGDGAIKLVAVITTETTKEARRRHSLSYLSTVILGRAMSTGLLLASSMKINQGRVTVKFQSDGPLKGLYIDAGKDGTVRGYVGNPELELDLIKENGAKPYFDFKSAVGKGYLHVSRDNGTGQPFTSTVELVEGGVGEDIASYLLHSEQTESAVFVGEKIENSEIICSGALIAQIMPKVSENKELLYQLEDQCKNISHFSDKLFQCKDKPTDLFKELFPLLKIKVIRQPNNFQKISFKCRCSKERSMSALKLLGKAELIQILEEEKKSELTCKFCSSVYIINETELSELIRSM